MIPCPLCRGEQASRQALHAHLVEAHPSGVEMWNEPATGKMRYRVSCPHCEQAHEARVKPRSLDPEFLEQFAREIRLVAFDMLLNHLEAEHEVLPGRPPAPPRSPLLPASAGGGRGRPGVDGIPMPPGYGEPELPAWARAAKPLKVTHVDDPRSKK
ncbi:MAG: hypothetical protein ACYC91_06625 [Solirubrobacteraceae bacterium]